MTALSLEPQDESGGHCDCCGHTSRTVWGLVAADGATAACYYVQWTVDGVPKHGANFDVVIGRWGEGAGPSDRVVVALEYRLLDNGPAFKVIDAAARGKRLESLASQALQRSQVIGTPLADQTFAMTDLILAQDPRVSELRGGWTIGAG